MSKNKDQKHSLKELRAKAESKLNKKIVRLRKQSPGDLERVLQELRTHQIELEMQNEQLRRTQDELEISRVKYSNLYDFAPVGYFVLDKSGIVVEANLTAAALVGIERKPLLGRHLGPRIVKADRDAFYMLRQQVFESGNYQRCELSLLRGDGSEFPAELLIDPVKDAKDNVVQCRIAVIDSTERKKIERLMNEARMEIVKEKNRLEAVMEAMPIGISILDEKGGNVQANRAFEEIWGGPRPRAQTVRDYVKYKAWWADTGKPVKPDDWASAQAVQKGKTVTGQILEIERFDGTHAHVLNNAAPVREAEGKIIGSAVAIQDITDLRKAEEALRHSKENLRKHAEQLKATLEAAPAMIWTALDSQCREIIGNRAAYEFSRIKKGENLSKTGTKPEKLVHYRVFKNGKELAPKDMPIQKVAASGKKLRNYSMEFVFDDGDVRSLLGNVNPILDSKGKPSGAVAMFVDITERKAAEEALRQEIAERKKAEEEIKKLARFPAENPNPVLRFSQDGKILFSNGPGGVLLEKWNSKVGDIVPPEWLQTIGQALRTKRERVQEIECGERIYLFVVAPISESGYVNLYGRDVTKERQANKALQKAHNELEKRVRERTAELQQTNERLKKEIEERTHTEQSLRLEEARLDALLRLSQMSEEPLDKITGITLEQAIALTQSKIGFLGFLNEEGTVYTLHSVSKDVVKECNVTGNPMHWPVADAGIWADSIKQRKTIFINDYSKPHPRKKGIPPGHVPIERFMVVPIFEGKKIVAVAGVGNKTHDYDKSDERQITLLLSGMLACTQKNLARQALHERAEELSRVNKELSIKIEEHRRAEEKIKAERQRFNDVLETLPAYVCLLTPDYRMPFTNRVFRESFGEPKDKKCYEFLFDRTQPCENCQTYKVLETGKSHHWEWAGPNGRDYDIFDYPFTDTDGSSLILEMGIDVTEQKRAQEALHSSALYMRALLEASIDPLVTISRNGKITDVNKATETVTGLLRENLIGTDFSDYFTEPEFARHVYKKVLSEGRIKDHPLTVRHVSGITTDVLYNATVYKNEAGQIQGVFAAARDITERKKTEKQSRLTNLLLELFVQKTTRKEYLDSVVRAISDWSCCQCAGIRLVDSNGYSPYESSVGFRRKFLNLENKLSLKTDTCACMRAITQAPQEHDKLLMTSKGSFYSSNTLEFVDTLPEQAKSQYHDNCIKSGFKSLAIIPINYRSKVLGALHLADKRPAKFPLDAVEFLENIAILIGEAVHRFDTEAALRISGSRLIEAQRIAHLGNWEWSIKTGEIWWSDEIYRIFGLSPDRFESTYEAFLSCVHPDDRILVEKSLNEALYEGKQYNVDYRIIRPDNSERIVQAQGEVVFDKTGNPVKMVGTLQDITERVKTQEAARQSEEKFLLLAQASEDVFWIRTPGIEQMIFISPAYEKLWGRSRKSLYQNSRSFLDAIHPDDKQTVKNGIKDHMRGKWEFIYRIIRPDGSISWVHDKGYPILDEKGRLYLMAGTVRDITEIKQAEFKIIEHQRELRSLAAELQLVEERERRQIAQDLHDSIGQILSFSSREIKSLKKSAPENIMHSLGEISNQLDVAVKQVRTLSFDLSPSILYDLGFEVALEDLIEKMSEERKINCSFKNCRAPKPLADEVSIFLYRSVRELLINISKHANANTVVVSMVRKGNDLHISVKDDGVGMEVSEMLESSKRPKGFGIFSIRERLNHIGGRFQIKSTIGKGTTVTLIAPLNINPENQEKNTLG
jgi:PAS domain S-box-containing protein